MDGRIFCLALVVIVSFDVLMGMLYFIELPQQNVAPVNQLLGALAATFVGVGGYCFAGSWSSRRKDETIASALSSKTDALAAVVARVTPPTPPTPEAEPTETEQGGAK